ncbi:MAG TPA: hypothetical protein VGH23_01545 [Rhizomicrobium sp.]|jgi:hypothetical protein
MGDYEIRLLNEDGTVATANSENAFNDAAAIHAAHKVAKGRAFEVWRGSERIYPAPSRRKD